MKYLVPLVALCGLLVVVSLPAPGLLGVTIGGGCVVVILVCGLLLALNAVAERLVAAWGRRRPRRAIHAQSGITRKI